MAILVDTNVLVRYADREDPRYPATRKAVVTLREREPLRTTTQNLVELWNVLTRPADRNGFGRAPAEAAPLLEITESLFPRLEDRDTCFELWKSLVLRFEVSRVQVHDARLVAAMLTHGVSTILTFNGRDFHRYTEVGIRSMDPGDL